MVSLVFHYLPWSQKPEGEADPWNIQPVVGMGLHTMGCSGQSVMAVVRLQKRKQVNAPWGSAVQSAPCQIIGFWPIPGIPVNKF